MTDLFQKYGTPTAAITTGMNGLGSNGSAESAEIDNGTTRHLGMEIECEFAAAGANSGFVSVYIAEGQVSGSLATGVVPQNMRVVGTVQLNGTTLVRKMLRVNGISKYLKIVVINTSGGGLAATNNRIDYVGLNLTDT